MSLVRDFLGLGRVGGQWVGMVRDGSIWSLDHALPRDLDAVGMMEAQAAGSVSPSTRLELNSEQLENPLHGSGAVWCCLGNALPSGVGDSGSADSDEIPPFDAFVRASSSVSGPVDGVVIPSDSAGRLRRVRHELEVALLLGDSPSVEDPLSSVTAVSLALDLAATGSEDRSLRKSLPTLCPLGPVLIPWLGLNQLVSSVWTLRVNGETRQTTSLADLRRGPAEVLSSLHSCVGLARGDLVLLGAPAGGGFLERGDSAVASWDLGPDLRLEVT